MSYEIHPAQAAAQERRPPPLWPALASLKIPAWKRGATATHKSLGVSMDNEYVEHPNVKRILSVFLAFSKILNVV